MGTVTNGGCGETRYLKLSTLRNVILLCRRRRLARAIPPIATPFSVMWSVCRLSHLYTDIDAI